MSNQPRRPATAEPARLSVSSAFDRDEWELIVTLPRRVLLAAVAAAPVEGRTAAEGIAGIEAIASGLASPSGLVRETVASIYQESFFAAVEAGSHEAAAEPTLAACRYAAELLASRVDRAEAEAYQQWLLHIAAVVSGVAQGAAARPEEGSFLTTLATLLPRS